MLFPVLLSVLAIFSAVPRPSSGAYLSFSEESISIQDVESQEVQLSLSEPLDEDVTVEFTYYTRGRMESREGAQTVVKPLSPVVFPARSVQVDVPITAKEVGSTVIGVNSTSHLLNRLDEVYLSVYVVHHKWLVVISEILGWGFFTVWSICAYPLLFTVIRTRSFAGISYGFVALCLVSFWAYTFYCCAMFFSETVQAQYMRAHPGGVRPVQPEDVALTTHLSILFTFMSILAFFFDGGGQRLSGWLIITCVGFTVYGVVLFTLAAADVMTWLQTMYGLALIKMITMPMKYMPQVWQNYQRKSTEGFNVWFSWLDVLAGSMTVLQMFVIAINGDDWGSFLGNLPKFVLGVSSVLFDVILLSQHYLVYKGKAPYTGINSDNDNKKGNGK